MESSRDRQSSHRAECRSRLADEKGSREYQGGAAFGIVQNGQDKFGKCFKTFRRHPNAVTLPMQGRKTAIVSRRIMTVKESAGHRKCFFLTANECTSAGAYLFLHPRQCISGCQHRHRKCFFLTANECTSAGAYLFLHPRQCISGCQHRHLVTNIGECSTLVERHDASL